MQFTTLLPIVFAAAASAITVSWDSKYDNGDLSLFDTVCSDGPNGLIRAERTKLDQFPTFPYVGGAQYIEGWNSNLCGACYQLAYNGSSIYLTAVDSASEGFNISWYAFNHLLGGQADSYGNYGSYGGNGSIEAEVTQIDSKYCGRP
ncbi:Cerato-platanin [Peniophora sp. CONT]|nr:Cerato-platanin [Peniophora sp. CONT]